VCVANILFEMLGRAESLPTLSPAEELGVSSASQESGDAEPTVKAILKALALKLNLGRQKGPDFA